MPQLGSVAAQMRKPGSAVFSRPPVPRRTVVLYMISGPSHVVSVIPDHHVVKPVPGNTAARSCECVRLCLPELG